MKRSFGMVLASVVIFSTLIGGWLGGNHTVMSDGSSSAFPSEFLTNFSETLDLIQRDYVEDVGSDTLVYSAIKGMLRALDPHSNFLDPKEFAKLREDQHSIYYGLGIQIRPLAHNRGRHVIIENPSPDTPAGRRGLLLGDVITKIDGQPVDDWRTDEIVSHLKGPRRTAVNITIERPGNRKPLQFEVERDEIPLITVPCAFEVKPGIGYVKIERFSETTAKELGARLDQFTGLAGLIVDLRENPGGLLNQAIEIADFFLHPGALVVSTKGRMEKSAKSYEAPGGEKIKIPLVILINRQSASASEIVAGALQDHDRALIVGETSFGKGLVQTVYTLANDTGMTLTTAKYYTPSGRLIQRDYSGSSFKYLFLEMNDEMSSEPREVWYTDSNRKVYGGGGITPDILEPARELNRFELTLASKDLFFQYGRHLLLDEGQMAGKFRLPVKREDLKNLDIDEALLSDFKRFLQDRQVEFSEDDFKANIDFVKRRIKQDTYISAFGIKESFKIGIQGDNQVLKALEMMPEAKTLMSVGHTSPLAQNRH